MSVIQLPSSKTSIKTNDGQEFDVGLVEMTQAIETLGKKASEEGEDHYAFLDRLIAHVQERYGVLLSLDDADAVATCVPLKWLAQKSEWAASGKEK